MLAAQLSRPLTAYYLRNSTDALDMVTGGTPLELDAMQASTVDATTEAETRRRPPVGGRALGPQLPLLVVTRGENGCSIFSPDGRVDVEAVVPERIVDPTGVGDAFRAGIMKGLASGADFQVPQPMANSGASSGINRTRRTILRLEVGVRRI